MHARRRSASSTMTCARAFSGRSLATSDATPCPLRTYLDSGHVRSTTAMGRKVIPARPSGPSARPAPRSSRAQPARASTPAPQSRRTGPTSTATPAFPERSPRATNADPRPLPETRAMACVKRGRTARVPTPLARPAASGVASRRSRSVPPAPSMATVARPSASNEPALSASPKARHVHPGAAWGSAAAPTSARASPLRACVTRPPADRELERRDVALQGQRLLVSALRLAGVAKLVDAQDLGSCIGNNVEVQFLSSASIPDPRLEPRVAGLACRMPDADSPRPECSSRSEHFSCR